MTYREKQVDFAQVGEDVTIGISLLSGDDAGVSEWLKKKKKL